MDGALSRDADCEFEGEVDDELLGDDAIMDEGSALTPLGCVVPLGWLTPLGCWPLERYSSTLL